MFKGYHGNLTQLNRLFRIVVNNPEIVCRENPIRIKKTLSSGVGIITEKN